MHEETYVRRTDASWTDVRLPDEPARKILDLIQENSPYKYFGIPYIKYNRVNTDALRKTKIRKL